MAPATMRAPTGRRAVSVANTLYRVLTITEPRGNVRRESPGMERRQPREVLVPLRGR